MIFFLWYKLTTERQMTCFLLVDICPSPFYCYCIRMTSLQGGLDFRYFYFLENFLQQGKMRNPPLIMLVLFFF